MENPIWSWFGSTPVARSSEKLGLYFERNYRGRVDITVQPDGTISWTDRISIWPSGY
jgi:hypothetical protein